MKYSSTFVNPWWNETVKVMCRVNKKSWICSHICCSRWRLFIKFKKACFKCSYSSSAFNILFSPPSAGLVYWIVYCSLSPSFFSLSLSLSLSFSLSLSRSTVCLFWSAFRHWSLFDFGRLPSLSSQQSNIDVKRKKEGKRTRENNPAQR